MEAPAELQGLLWPGIPRVLLHKQGGPRGHHRGEHRVVVVHLQGALECTHREPPEIVGQVEVRCQAADRLDVPHLLRRAGATRSGRMLPAFDVEVGNDASTVVLHGGVGPPGAGAPGNGAGLSEDECTFGMLVQVTTSNERGLRNHSSDCQRNHSAYTGHQRRPRTANADSRVAIRSWSAVRCILS